MAEKKPARPALTAENFIRRLKAMRSDEEARKIRRYFKTGPGESAENDTFLGVRMGDVFALAREFIDMPIGEIEKVLLDPHHEIRAGALSVMDKRCRKNSTGDAERGALFDLYLKRIDRIDNWDLVDLAAPYVVGRRVFDRSRAPLFRLARSKNLWARRTAMYACGYLIRMGDLDDAFRIGEELIHDAEEPVSKSAGAWLGFAGKKDPSRLRALLDRHAATMPRVALRAAIERLAPAERKKYMAMRAADGPEEAADPGPKKKRKTRD